jgi:hypothetical protein
MRMKINQKMAGGASAIGSMSRRSFLAASAAVAVPTAVVAKSDRLHQSLEAQLDDCVAQLRSILMRMHPEANKFHHYLDSRGDGSFRLTMQGNRKFIEYDGPGLYLVSNRVDEIVECWLEQVHHTNIRTGEPIPHFFYFRSVECVDGVPVDDCLENYHPKIIRKLRSGPFPAIAEGEN